MASNVTVVYTLLDKMSKTLDKISNAAKNYNKQIEDAKRRTEGLENAQNRGSSGADNYAKSQSNANRQVDQLGKSNQAAERSQNSLNSSLGRGSTSLQGYSRDLNTVNRDHNTASRAVQGLESDMGSLTRSFEGGGLAASRLGTNLGKTGGAFSNISRLMQGGTKDTKNFSSALGIFRGDAEGIFGAFEKVGEFGFFKAGVKAGLEFFQVTTMIATAVPLLSTALGGLVQTLGAVGVGIMQVVGSLGRLTGALGAVGGGILAAVAGFAGLKIIMGMFVQPAVKGAEELKALDAQIGRTQHSIDKKQKKAKELQKQVTGLASESASTAMGPRRALATKTKALAAAKDTTNAESQLNQLLDKRKKLIAGMADGYQRIADAVAGLKEAWQNVWLHSDETTAIVTNIVRMIDSIKSLIVGKNGKATEFMLRIITLYSKFFGQVADAVEWLAGPGGKGLRDGLGDVLEGALKNLAAMGPFFAAMAPFLTELGKAMNTAFSSALIGIMQEVQKADSREFGKNITNFFLVGIHTFGIWAHFFTNIIQGLRSIGRMFDYITPFEDGLVGISEAFENWAKNMEAGKNEKGREKLKKFFEGSIKILKALGFVLMSVGDAIASVLSDEEAVAATVKFFKILGGGLQKYGKFMAKSLRELGPALNEFWLALGRVFSGQGDAMIESVKKMIHVFTWFFDILNRIPGNILEFILTMRIGLFALGIIAGNTLTPLARLFGLIDSGAESFLKLAAAQEVLGKELPIIGKGISSLNKGGVLTTQAQRTVGNNWTSGSQWGGTRASETGAMRLGPNSRFTGMLTEHQQRAQGGTLKGEPIPELKTVSQAMESQGMLQHEAKAINEAVAGSNAAQGAWKDVMHQSMTASNEFNQSLARQVKAQDKLTGAVIAYKQANAGLTKSELERMRLMHIEGQAVEGLSDREKVVSKIIREITKQHEANSKAIDDVFIAEKRMIRSKTNLNRALKVNTKLGKNATAEQKHAAKIAKAFPTKPLKGAKEMGEVLDDMLKPATKFDGILSKAGRTARFAGGWFAKLSIILTPIIGVIDAVSTNFWGAKDALKETGDFITRTLAPAWKRLVDAITGEGSDTDGKFIKDVLDTLQLISQITGRIVVFFVEWGTKLVIVPILKTTMDWLTAIITALDKINTASHGWAAKFAGIGITGWFAFKTIAPIALKTFEKLGARFAAIMAAETAAGIEAGAAATMLMPGGKNKKGPKAPRGGGGILRTLGGVAKTIGGYWLASKIPGGKGLKGLGKKMIGRGTAKASAKAAASRVAPSATSSTGNFGKKAVEKATWRSKAATAKAAGGATKRKIGRSVAKLGAKRVAGVAVGHLLGPAAIAADLYAIEKSREDLVDTVNKGKKDVKKASKNIDKDAKLRKEYLDKAIEGKIITKDQVDKLREQSDELSKAQHHLADTVADRDTISLAEDVIGIPGENNVKDMAKRVGKSKKAMEKALDEVKLQYEGADAKVKLAAGNLNKYEKSGLLSTVVGAEKSLVKTEKGRIEELNGIISSDESQIHQLTGGLGTPFTGMATDQSKAISADLTAAKAERDKLLADVKTNKKDIKVKGKELDRLVKQIFDESVDITGRLKAASDTADANAKLQEDVERILSPTGQSENDITKANEAIVQQAARAQTRLDNAKKVWNTFSKSEKATASMSNNPDLRAAAAEMTAAQRAVAAARAAGGNGPLEQVSTGVTASSQAGDIVGYTGTTKKGAVLEFDQGKLAAFTTDMEVVKTAFRSVYKVANNNLHIKMGELLDAMPDMITTKGAPVIKAMIELAAAMMAPFTTDFGVPGGSLYSFLNTSIKSANSALTAASAANIASPIIPTIGDADGPTTAAGGGRASSGSSSGFSGAFSSATSAASEGVGAITGVNPLLSSLDSSIQGMASQLLADHPGTERITSTRRSAAANAAAGGSPTSQHVTGMAMDIVPEPWSQERGNAFANWVIQNKDKYNVNSDQVFYPAHQGNYDHSDHVHIGFGGGGSAMGVGGGMADMSNLPEVPDFGSGAAGSLATALATKVRESLTALGGSEGSVGGTGQVFNGDHAGLDRATPSMAQAYARSVLGNYGWGEDQMAPLKQMWDDESGWKWNSDNPTSDAYGIPQALPGSKMSSMGSDWSTNAGTQIDWGLWYLKQGAQTTKSMPGGGYGSPAQALVAKNSTSPHWYGNGGDFIAKKPQLIGVGDKQPERVTVSPVSGSNKGKHSGNKTTVVNSTINLGHLIADEGGLEMFTEKIGEQIRKDIRNAHSSLSHED